MIKLYTLFAVLLFGVASSAVAEVHARTTATTHMRPQLFHDRTPHVHQRDVQQRQR